MIAASLPPDEEKRLEELRHYAILDSANEQDFDEIAKLASSICKTPISLITLIDEKRQWFKSSIGMEGKETSRDTAFCAHAIHQNEVMVVDDASNDIRFSDNPLVTGQPNIKFYAGMPLITPNGYKLGTLCVIDRKPRSLTEEQLLSLRILSKQVVKQLELRLKVKELEEQKLELSRLNKAGNRLLTIIGHDLRSPLNSLIGLMHLSEEKGLSQESFQELLGEVRTNLYSGSNLLSNLLSWAKQQFEGKGLRREKLLLNELVAHEIDANIFFHKEKNNLVINNISEDLGIHADANALSFIIRNLLVNANKFCDNGTIEVKAFSTDNEVCIQVSDTGTGIDVENQQFLFDVRINSSTKGTKGEKGSGLGLPVCKEFVEKHGGKIWVESFPGKGSTFSFTIPQ